MVVCATHHSDSVMLLFAKIVILLFSLVGLSNYTFATCTINAFTEDSKPNTSYDFLAGDRILLRIKCPPIPAGKHSITVNWIKNNYGVVRSDVDRFTLLKDLPREFSFWFQLSKQGLLRRLTDGGTYNSRMLGDWIVTAIIDNSPALSLEFTIN